MTRASILFGIALLLMPLIPMAAFSGEIALLAVATAMACNIRSA